MKVTFPYWGNYTIAFEALVKKLNIPFIPPEETNLKAIEEGAKLSPELFCFPFKVNMGNYLPALKKGVDTIFMWENVTGSCRMRYYWLIQEKALQEAGFDVKVINFNSRNLFSRAKEIKKQTNVSFWQIVTALAFFLKEVFFIDKLEEKTRYFRPREKNQGETDRIIREALGKLKGVERNKELSDLKKETWRKFAEIVTNKKQECIRVGIIGEIYTVTDEKVNFGIDKKLGEMGIEVHRKLTLSEHLKEGFLPWKEKMLQRKVNHYLKSTVGGHGRQAVEEMLEYGKKKFDGVVHLLPFGCMPEVTVRPILQNISQENKIPFLSISLDEQTAEVGIQTRLEAFVDLMKSRKKNN